MGVRIKFIFLRTTNIVKYIILLYYFYGFYFYIKYNNIETIEIKT